MRKFVLRRRKRWVARAFGRNPLVRWTDRVEACAILAAILLALGVCAVSVAQGAAVYRSHTQLYAAQARMRHMVTATVAATGSPPREPHTTTSVVLATWPSSEDGARGGELDIDRAEWVTTDRAVADGDQIHLWLNDAGRQVDPPTPLTQAGVDAIGAGAGIEGCAVLGLMAGVALVRTRLDRIRRAQLEREIDRFASGDTTNHSQ
jgi:hypothetical protein